MTVSVARTATPITAPVVPLMPLGRSTLRTGAPLALMASMMSCGSPLTGRLRPAPNSASMISAGAPTAIALQGSTGPFQPRAASAASPCRVSRSHSRMMETLRPRATSSVAATKPSPPLLPRPATTRIGPCSTRSMAASATAWPARSISAKPGVPPAIASRSACSISVVVRTSMLNSHLKRLILRHFYFRTRSAGPDDCMQIGLFAYFVSFAMFDLRLWSTPSAL